MVTKLLHSHSPFRIFFISATITASTLGAVYYWLGPAAAAVALILIIIEITFSFENAIINAKVLATLSPFWQKIFLTIGIAIAIFGMRIIFPIVIVSITAQLEWEKVIALALNEPKEYSRALTEAHTSIAAFGGMFLLVLGLHFFISTKRTVFWIKAIEHPLQKRFTSWAYIPVSIAVLAAITLIPFNNHADETLKAGAIGIAVYLAIHGLAHFFGKTQAIRAGLKKTGLAGFIGFLYLEVLDASFSFDGVIGAFAVTQDVVLIAAGLGVGAIWVRSLTIFMVRRGTLQRYKYLEHGAHYTILVLAGVLLAGLFTHVPEIIAGVAGISIISSSIFSSVLSNKMRFAKR